MFQMLADIINHNLTLLTYHFQALKTMSANDPDLISFILKNLIVAEFFSQAAPLIKPSRFCYQTVKIRN